MSHPYREQGEVREDPPPSPPEIPRDMMPRGVGQPEPYARLAELIRGGARTVRMAAGYAEELLMVAILLDPERGAEARRLFAALNAERPPDLGRLFGALVLVDHERRLHAVYEVVDPPPLPPAKPLPVLRIPPPMPQGFFDRIRKWTGWWA